MSETGSKYRYVFLDTEFFVANNFDYENKYFSKLARLVSENLVALLITSVVRQEIISEINTQASEASDRLHNLRNKVRILRNCRRNDFRSIFNLQDKRFIISELSNQFNTVVRSLNIEVIQVNDVDVDAIFDRYFDRQPPFGEARKKCEFPDAFTVAALEKFCKEKDEKMYVIGNDPDLNKYCQESKSLDYIESVDKLFEIFALREYPVPDQIRLKLEAESQLNRLEGVIENKVFDDFGALGFIVTEVDGEVTDVSVENATITDKSLIEMNEDEVIFNCLVLVEFNAEISYLNPETSVFDSEDQKYLFADYNTALIDDSVKIKVQVNIPKKNDDYDIDNAKIEIEDQDDIWISPGI